MPSSPTTRIRAEKQAAGENLNTWGDTRLNEALSRFDEAIAGRTAFALSGSKTLTATNYVADEARSMVLDVTSGTGGTITIPAVEKAYLVRNGSSGSVIVTTGGGTTATLAAGEVRFVFCDATNVRMSLTTDFGGSVLKNLGTPVSAADACTKDYADNLALTAAAGNLPGQTGNAGKFLTTDGSTASWAASLTAANNLSELTNAATARTNLGLGTAAVLASTAICLKADNLSGLSNYTTARSNLGLAIGSNVQAYDAKLAAFAGLTGAANKLAYFTGTSTMATTDFSANGITLVGQTFANMRTSLGLVIGTDVQAYSAKTAAIAALTWAADKVPYFTSSSAVATADLTSFARTLLDDANSTTARATLGVVIGTDVQAYSAKTAAIASLTWAADTAPYFTSTSAVAAMTVTSFARTVLDDADATTMRATLGVYTFNAVGLVTSAGNVSGNSTGIASASRTNTGRFTVTLNNAPALGAALVTPISATALVAYVTAIVSGTSVAVEFKNVAGTYTDPDYFSILVPA